jgi:hypothetical protein
MKVITIAALVAVLMLFGTYAYAGGGYDCNNGGRYEDNNNGTVTDCRTGLIWLKNAKCPDQAGGVTPTAGELTWHDAMKWVAGLHNGLCGLSDGSAGGDWRLPTKTEWMAMVQSANNQGIANPSMTNDAGTAKWGTGTSSFTNVQSYYYWSSTTDTTDTTKAWDVYLMSGVMTDDDKATGSFIWPVRGGQSRSIGSVRIE